MQHVILQGVSQILVQDLLADLAASSGGFAGLCLLSLPYPHSYNRNDAPTRRSVSSSDILSIYYRAWDLIVIYMIQKKAISSNTAATWDGLPFYGLIAPPANTTRSQSQSRCRVSDGYQPTGVSILIRVCYTVPGRRPRRLNNVARLKQEWSIH